LRIEKKEIQCSLCSLEVPPDSFKKVNQRKKNELFSFLPWDLC
jgi:hypothetical protein